MNPRLFIPARNSSPMKSFLRFLASVCASLVLALGSSSAADVDEKNLFDETYQFIFFATLEGLYRDGVTSADVDALLVTRDRDNRGGYLNFIFTCPICMPVEAAIATYKERPRIDHTKIPNYQATNRTFGFGLPQETTDA